MALYMAQFAYTPEAWTAFTKHPEDRTKAVQALAQKLGCRFEATHIEQKSDEVWKSIDDLQKAMGGGSTRRPIRSRVGWRRRAFQAFH
jgi:hypothetical protein